MELLVTKERNKSQRLEEGRLKAVSFV